MEMQGERNKLDLGVSLKSERRLGSLFDSYTSLKLQRTSHCPDPTVAMACV